jgi:hypothetical protein
MSEPTYRKYRWDENRGDSNHDWGPSWWYFEFGDDGYITRHIEAYDNGPVLRYGLNNREDEFGFLACGRLGDMDHPGEPLTAEEFESIWHRIVWPTTG